MATLLQIDASARAGRSGIDPHGSHTRRLTARFAARWQASRAKDTLRYRDVAAEPPRPVDGAWVAAAFTPPATRTAAMRDALAESDRLVAELLAADVLVIGAPMYNFGLPATLKAWIDNIVRVGVTFGFDRGRGAEPYWPMLPPGKRLVIVSARGDFGYDPGERIAHLNHVEGGLAAPLGYIGLTDTAGVAVEYDEFGDDRLRASLTRAEAAIDDLANRLADRMANDTP
ncbi:FMN-dependent NADH-azoreductase [Tistrella bauzanensis]|uniref:FMN dependent NADH:quinone oxidoreductase n=1 Tax=Tistrella bauzanensis TaxID=657419 RepID=A0ABQ1II18_9PROT|nr:NAD(P)H-dependent oxidoreductase [Tistrella bauzanensis]GGB42629.1 FMN-dependent NADH-azoreductase [Tistrella bauzanensis]